MRKRERGGKVAGTDIITAQLQLQQRECKHIDAQTAAPRARIAHVVMLLSNSTQTYAIIEDFTRTCPLAKRNIFVRANSPHNQAAGHTRSNKELMTIDIREIIRNLISRPALQPLWSSLLKLCHAGMNYGGGQAVRSSGELGALSFAARSFSPTKPIVIFDVGANNGDYLEGARSVLHHDGLCIFSFEPQSSCFLALQTRYQNDPSIHIRQVALGKECGTVDLYFSEEGESTASLYGARSRIAVRPAEVEMTTIDQACQEADLDHIDFLKIDTEGHEIDVLLGAKQMIEAGRIAAIQFEFGDTFVETSYHFSDVFNLLSPRYTIYRILRNGLIEVPRYSYDLEIFKLANFLCLQKNSSARPN